MFSFIFGLGGGVARNLMSRITGRNNEGEDCTADMKGNTNVSLNARKSKLGLAENVDVKINCDGGKVTVIDAVNHQLKPAEPNESHELVNKLELKKTASSNSCEINFNNNRTKVRIIQIGGSGNFINGRLVPMNQEGVSVGGGGRHNSNWFIDYAHEAVIDGGNYKLGLFEFKKRETEPGRFQIVVDQTGFQNIEIEQVETSKVTIKATKDDDTQILKLEAPLIHWEDSPDELIFIME